MLIFSNTLDLMIIGLSGKIKAGKDTAGLMISWMLFQRLSGASFDALTYASYLRAKDEIGISASVYYHIKRFADGLKLCVASLLGINDSNMLNSHVLKESYLPWLPSMSVRELLQKLGTAVRNEVHPDFWVNYTLQKCEPVNSYWVITDVRFMNEVKAIKDENGIVVRINRPHSNLQDKHISEIELDSYSNWDYVINNNSDLEYLFNECKKICMNTESK